MGDKDVDEQFAAIVAHWDEVESLPDRPERPDRPQDGPGDDAPDGVGSDPLGAEREASGQSPAPGVNRPLEPSPNPTNPPPTRPFVVWRGAETGAGSSAAPTGGSGPDDPDGEYRDPVELADLDDDEHFEPGPLAPLPPQEDVQFWGIIVGLVAGPLLLLWLVLFRPDVSDWWTLGALGLIVGGFVLLVLRQPHSRDEDDPDNGARV